jgi:hypothetical protein
MYNPVLPFLNLLRHRVELNFFVFSPKKDSPYEIFVRNLVAMDGATNTELVLIDDRGCPAETSIMSELRKSKDSEKILISSFDAFRFPSSDMVQV